MKVLALFEYLYSFHELGHNLGLEHGGNEPTGYKPNYLSVMNYQYTLSGLKRADGTICYGFSTRTGTTIDENQVIESRGLGAASQGFMSLWDYQWFPPRSGIDFNRDRVISTEPQAIDLNNDGQLTSLSAPNDLEIMKFQAHLPALDVQSGPQAPQQITHEETHKEIAEQLSSLAPSYIK